VLYNLNGKNISFFRQNNPEHEIIVKYEQQIIKLNDVDSKKLYSILISKKSVASKARIKHCDICNIDDTNDIWSDIYLMPIRTMYDNSIKEMQYKVLHRYMPTNKLLHKMETIDSPRCNFCNLYSETLEHLFYECIQLHTLWRYVANICSEWCNTVISFDCRDIILGYNVHENQTMNNMVINKLILYCKYYIVQCKYSEKVPNVIGMKKTIKYHQLCDDVLRNLIIEE